MQTTWYEQALYKQCLHHHLKKQGSLILKTWFLRLKDCGPDGQQYRSSTGTHTLTTPFHFVHLQVFRCIRDVQEAEYRDLKDHFVAWCGNSHLILDVNKTKDIISDLERNRVRSNPVSIMGEEVVSWWSNTNTSVITWTTDWTRDATVKRLQERTEQTGLVEETKIIQDVKQGANSKSMLLTVSCPSFLLSSVVVATSDPGIIND